MPTCELNSIYNKKIYNNKYNKHINANTKIVKNI